MFITCVDVLNTNNAIVAMQMCGLHVHEWCVSLLPSLLATSKRRQFDTPFDAPSERSQFEPAMRCRDPSTRLSVMTSVREETHTPTPASLVPSSLCLCLPRSERCPRHREYSLRNHVHRLLSTAIFLLEREGRKQDIFVHLSKEMV